MLDKKDGNCVQIKYEDATEHALKRFFRVRK